MTRTAFVKEFDPAITIKAFQLPPAECSPNSRCHWSVKKRAGDNYGNEIYYTATLVSRPHFNKAVVSLELVVKDHRRRDLDNFWTRFKPGMDALVRAGILEDDDMEHVQHGDIKVTVDPARAPMTIIKIQEG
jgi:Holliday junction resolvase RusA-like endonuclease